MIGGTSGAFGTGLVMISMNVKSQKSHSAFTNASRTVSSLSLIIADSLKLLRRIDWNCGLCRLLGKCLRFLQSGQLASSNWSSQMSGAAILPHQSLDMRDDHLWHAKTAQGVSAKTVSTEEACA